MAITFDTGNKSAFAAAIDLLASFENKPRTQNFAVATAVLLHRSAPGVDVRRRVLYQPDDRSKLVSTADLQKLVCDRTWEKTRDFVSGGEEASIFKPFTTRFFPWTNNNWRNSFDLQAGLSCDAPITSRFLLNDEYLSERRYDCVFRDAITASCNSPAGLFNSNRTCFNPAKRNDGQIPGPETNARHLPKLLTRGFTDIGPGYWYIEPNVDVLTDLLAKADARIPLFPFMVALYAGSDYWASQSTEISEARLRADLALDVERFVTLFDSDLRAVGNSRMLAFASDTRRASRPRNVIASDSSSSSNLSPPTQFSPRGDIELVRRAGEQADPDRRLRLLERATTGHRRTLNRLAEILESSGYALYEQLDGYDLRATRGSRECLFEVKTWTEANLFKQIRSGWAQLYEYRYRNALSDEVVLYLVFDRPPPEDLWVWPWLVGDLEVVPCWIGRDALATFPEFRANLPPQREM